MLTTPASAKNRGRKGRLIPTAAFGITALLLLVILVLLPISLNSVEAEITHQSTSHFVIADSPTPTETVHSDVDLTVTALNEWENTATIRVAIHQTCDRACPWGDRYLFISVYGDSAGGRRAQPSSQSVTLPATVHDVTESINLPVYGDPIRYPFDRYRLVLGIVVDRIFSDDTVQTLDPAEAKDYATVSLQARIPRAVMNQPAPVAAGSVAAVRPGEPYMTIEALTIGRPLYLSVLTVLLVLLMTAAAAYAVFICPLEQLLIDSAALILGVWGIRSILLGTGLPGFTLVDLAVALIILFLLITMTIRMLFLLESSSRFRILHRDVAEPYDQTPTSGVVPCDYVPADGVPVRRQPAGRGSEP